MFYQKINQETFLLRIKRKELIIRSLTKFSQRLKIKNAFFYGLGALDKVTLANYDTEAKKYSEKKFTGAFELANITGNVIDSDKGLIIHAHAALADEKMRTIGGHFVEGRVSGTVEVYFKKLDSEIIKKYDEETGLKLMELKQEI